MSLGLKSKPVSSAKGKYLKLNIVSACASAFFLRTVESHHRKIAYFLTAALQYLWL
jgi:hypothetical protein